MNVYSNLSRKRKTKKDSAARRRAEYLASLPKHPIKRTLHRMHPKRVISYWFSKRGALTLLKVGGVGVLLAVLLVGGLFAYYRKDLDQIRPGELAKRVQTTVSRYYDRNDKLLWEDKGDGNYKLVVESDEIADTMRQATIAVEDRDFYKHGGFSVAGLARAAVSNAQSDSVQGGSTLTQQLVKQVFFPPEEANKRGLDGIPRKIKEIILSVEVERMYDKDQILNLYLNESPYGGRRNGVESAAQTYFGTTAKKLTLAESALLAAIPNQPGLYDPYNVAGNDALIARQHKVLNAMVTTEYITQEEADKAKAVNILDTILPAAGQYKDIKAPHFIQSVKQELESELGKTVVGKGGLTIKTTLDIRIQNKLEQEMDGMFNSYYPDYAGFSNGAGTVEDVRTGQVIAMLGSRDFEYEGFGQDNAATAFIQPGSSIKPLVYAQLFQEQPGDALNYGSGSILSDTRTTFGGDYTPKNADSGFRGNIDLRKSLALSRNIPAIKAMAVSGLEPTLETIRKLGDKFYCTQGNEKQAGLSSAIGGCGTRMVDHVNALASLGRMGVYRPHTSVLEVKNNNGDKLLEYKEEKQKVIDSQSAYIVNEILGDTNERLGLFGRTITPELDAAGVKTSIKTGTSDIDGKPKDIWTVGYTPSIAAAVWLGNPDIRALEQGNSSIPAEILDPVMAYATDLYRKEKKVSNDEWFTRPKGIQEINGEIYPSYYNKKRANTNTSLTFDKVSKKLATDCTPGPARINVGVTKSTDPFTKKTVYLQTGEYNPYEKDDRHKCDDVPPSIAGIVVQDNSKIVVQVRKGTFDVGKLDISVGGQNVASINVNGSGTYSTLYDFTNSATVTATITDDGFYSDGGSTKYTSNTSNGNGNRNRRNN